MDLSHNLIDDYGCESISDIVTYCRRLRALFIGWNKIREKGAVSIFNSLAKNDTIDIFDGSFNSFRSRCDEIPSDPTKSPPNTKSSNKNQNTSSTDLLTPKKKDEPVVQESKSALALKAMFI